jgi:hypothetical protein
METGSSANRWWRGMKEGYFAKYPLPACLELGFPVAFASL